MGYSLGNHVLKSLYIHTYSSSLHPFTRRRRLAFSDKPCMGAVAEIKDFDSAPIHRAFSVLLSVCGKLKHPMMTCGTVP